MITSATFQGSEQIGENRYRAKLTLVTNDARGTFDKWFEVSGSTVQQLADDASRQIAAMNLVDPTKNLLAGIAVNTNVPVAYTAPAAPAQTAAQVWAGKAQRLARLRALGNVTGALAAAITALQADVDSTYQAGFVDAI